MLISSSIIAASAVFFLNDCDDGFDRFANSTNSQSVSISAPVTIFKISLSDVNIAQLAVYLANLPASIFFFFFILLSATEQCLITVCQSHLRQLLGETVPLAAPFGEVVVALPLRLFGVLKAPASGWEMLV